MTENALFVAEGIGQFYKNCERRKSTVELTKKIIMQMANTHTLHTQKKKAIDWCPAARPKKEKLSWRKK